MKIALAVAAVAALLFALPAAGAPSPVAGVAKLITGRQIANNTITGKDVKNKSLTKRDFRGSVRGPRGPQGVKGDTGANGAQGQQGPTGPSDAFTTSSPGSIAIDAAFTTVESLNLAAGKYVVSGRLSLQGAQQIVRCDLSPSDTGIDGTFTTVTGFQNEANVHDTVTLAAPATVLLRCQRFGASATGFERVLTAIKVGDIATQ